MADLDPLRVFPNSMKAAAVRAGQSRFYSREKAASVIPTTSVTLDPATIAAVTLSGGNLVATNTGTTSTNQGAMVAATSGKNSGKYYFEVINTTAVAGNSVGLGVGTISSTYTGMGGNNGTVGAIIFRANGTVSVNGVVTGTSLSTFSQGFPIGVAVDFDNRMIWFRKTPAGNWNNSGTANPATNVGGVAIPTGTMVPFVTMGGAGGAAGQVWTANFGASAFNGLVPSGFFSGWLI